MKQTIDVSKPIGSIGKKRKKKGGTRFTNSKDKKRRDLKKKELLNIEGQGTPLELQEEICIKEGISWRRRCKIQHINLESIEEEGQKGGLLDSTMGGRQNSSEALQSDSDEKTFSECENTVIFFFSTKFCKPVCILNNNKISKF